MAGDIHTQILVTIGDGAIHITHTAMVGGILMAMVLIGGITPTTTHGDTHIMDMAMGMEATEMDLIPVQHIHQYAQQAVDCMIHVLVADQQTAEVRIAQFHVV